MVQKIRIEGKEMTKDQYSKAILSTDHERLSSVKRMKALRRTDIHEKKKLEDEVKELRNEIHELKSIMMKFLNKNNISLL